MVWQGWERLRKPWANALAQCWGVGGHLPASAWGLSLCADGSHNAKVRGLAASTLETLVPCWAVLSTQAGGTASLCTARVLSPVLGVPPSPQGSLTQESHDGKTGGSPGTGRVPTPAVCYSQAHTLGRHPVPLQRGQ